MLTKLFSIKKYYDEQSFLIKSFNILGMSIPYEKCYGISDKSNEIFVVDSGENRKLNKMEQGLVIKVEGKNNKIYIDKNLQKRGLLIIVLGNDNVVKIGAVSNFNDSRILVQGDKNNVVFEDSCDIMRNLHLNCPTSNSTFYIGKDSSILGAEIDLRTQNANIKIGKECMLSNDITIMSGDGHKIIDKTTGEPIHKKGFVKIGERVWIGKGAVVCKNTNIPSGSIVGANSIVTKSFDEENIILAGVPAKIVKHNVEWTREYIF